MKIVMVEWLDACCEESHIRRELAREIRPILRRNYGEVVDEADDYITIAFGSLDNLFKGEEAVDVAFCIPRGCITSITKLDIKEK